MPDVTTLDECREKIVVSRPKLLACLSVLFGPILLLGFAFLISELLGGSNDPSLAANEALPAIKAKNSFNETLGAIALVVWILLMVPITIKSLYHRNRYVIIEDGQLICFGRSVCSMDDLKGVYIKEGYMKCSLFVDVAGGTVNAGNVILCDDIPYLIRFITKKIAGE